MTLATFTTSDLAFFLLIGVVIILLIWLIRLEIRFRRLMAGRQAGSLEDLIVEIGQNVKATDRVNDEIKKHLINMEARLQRSIQHVKTIRFNPFRGEGQGGNQSFATALLDEHGTGVVISGLYARDKVGVYSKPINERQSEYELTSEEKLVVKKSDDDKSR